MNRPHVLDLHFLYLKTMYFIHLSVVQILACVFVFHKFSFAFVFVCTQNDRVCVVNILEQNVTRHRSLQIIAWMFNVPIQVGRVSSLKNVCVSAHKYNADWSKYIGLSFWIILRVQCFCFEIWSTHHPIFFTSVSFHSLSHSRFCYLYTPLPAHSPFRFSLHHCSHLECEHVFYIWHMDGKNRGCFAYDI